MTRRELRALIQSGGSRRKPAPPKKPGATAESRAAAVEAARENREADLARWETIWQRMIAEGRVMSDEQWRADIAEPEPLHRRTSLCNYSGMGTYFRRTYAAKGAE